MEIFGFEIPIVTKYPIQVDIFYGGSGKPLRTTDTARVAEFGGNKQHIKLKERNKLLEIDLLKYTYPSMNGGRGLLLYTQDGQIYVPLLLDDNAEVLKLLPEASNQFLQAEAITQSGRKHMTTSDKAMIITGVFIAISLIGVGLFWKLATDNLGNVAASTAQISSSLQQAAANYSQAASYCGGKIAGASPPY